MNLIEFINKHIKTKVDFDGAFGAQCVDLFRQYCKDVFNIGHTGAVEGAKDLYLNYENMPEEIKHFVKIEKYFLPGDVLVWNKSLTNKYGHVAILVYEMADNLIVFEQDGFKQDGAKLAIRNKINLLGGLRKRYE